MKYVDKINVQQTLTVIFLGIALVYSITAGNENIAMAVGSGLVGYLGGITTKEV